MDVDRDALERSGEHHNAGQPPTPREAASVILLRGAQRSLELLLVKRNPRQRFMGGAWVFPGGAVEAGEGSDDGAHRSAALRELAEEAAVRLADPGALVAFSRWITPEQVKVRFDTRFYLAELPAGARPRPDGLECVDARWFSPAGALEAHHAGEIMLVFPTIKQLEQIDAFASARELIEHARATPVAPVQPRVLMSGETARIVLPGEPGYDEVDPAGR